VVAEEAGDLFQRHAGVGQQGHEAVPELAGRPGGGVESGVGDDAAEGAADVVGVQCGAGAGGEDQGVGSGWRVELGPVGQQDVDATAGEGDTAA
jgi:hypothetical protein